MTKIPNQEEKENMDLDSFRNPIYSYENSGMDGPRKKGLKQINGDNTGTNGPYLDTTRMNGYVNGGTTRKDDIRNPFLPLHQYDGSDTGSIGDDIGAVRMSCDFAPPDFNTLERGVQQANNVQEEIVLDNTADFNNGYTGITDGSDGPHREMAIDCPAGFRGSLKEPPKLPSSIQSSPVGTPKKGHKTVDKNVHNKKTTVPNTDREEQLHRIRKHQEELRKRREEEERLLRQEDFLRTSLRGSKKLQALESHPPPPHPVGFENEAFLEEPDGSLEADSGSEKIDILGVEASSPSSSHKLVQPSGETSAPAPIGIAKVLSSLNAIKSKLSASDNKEDIAFLNKLFQDTRFKKTVAIHQRISEITSRRPQPEPVCRTAQVECQDLLDSVSPRTSNPYVQELRKILEKPELQGLLLAHDRVSYQYQYAVPSGDDNDDEDEDGDDRLPFETVETPFGDSIKIIRIQKTSEHLGATVRNENGSVYIGRIVKGGAAEKSGLLHEGDEVLEVNGVEMRDKSVAQVSELLADMTGILTFMIVPNKEFSDPTDTLVHVRAHFNYDPEEDMYIPCRELGLSFSKGDVLHVINQDDANWWQAYREGEVDENPLAGLIPSQNFQEQREAIKQVIVQDSNESKKKKSRLCLRKPKKKSKKKTLYNMNSNDDFEAEEILTYEEVAQYYPQPNRKRPIVMVGPPHVGRQDLRRRLMESDVDRFAVAVPHTSRARKPDEIDGQDYHFVPKAIIENDILANKFVEHGEYDKNVYGTSLESIRQVINSGKVCVLDLHPQSLKILKMSDVKPYIIFISPPNIEKLRQNCASAGISLSDVALKEVIDSAREMEENFGHYFDSVLMNYDMDGTFEELMKIINTLEIKPQWVPAHWMRD